MVVHQTPLAWHGVPVGATVVVGVAVPGIKAAFVTIGESKPTINSDGQQVRVRRSRSGGLLILDNRGVARRAERLRTKSSIRGASAITTRAASARCRRHTAFVVPPDPTAGSAPTTICGATMMVSAVVMLSWIALLAVRDGARALDTSRRRRVTTLLNRSQTDGQLRRSRRPLVA
jgi:hypothetical protein